MSSPPWTLGFHPQALPKEPPSLTALLRARRHSTVRSAAHLQPPPSPPQISHEAATAVRPAGDKGQGLFATSLIPRGSIILEDPAFLGLTDGENLPELFAKYEALAPHDRAVFDHLSPGAPQPDRDAQLARRLAARGESAAAVTAAVLVAQRFLANAFNLDAADGHNEADGTAPPLRRAVFAQLARVNHACVPTAHAHYDPRRRAQVLHALVPLQPGTEITVAYFDLTLNRAARQERARAWGFVCGCVVCMPGPAAVQHEVLLETVRTARRAVGELRAAPLKKGMSRQDEAAKAVRLLEDALEKVRGCDVLGPVLPVLYDGLADVYSFMARAFDDGPADSAAVKCLLRAWEAERRLTGSESVSGRLRWAKLQTAEADARGRVEAASVQRQSNGGKMEGNIDVGRKRPGDEVLSDNSHD